MRALFVCDHRFIPVDGEVYSESQFSASVWKLYLKYFDELIILARKGGIPPDKEKADLEKSSFPGVSFAFGPNLSSPAAQMLKKREVGSAARQLVGEVDAVIMRVTSELGLVAINEARRAGVPYAVEVAGCPFDGLWNYGNWQGKVYAPIMALRTRRAVAKASFTLYVTREFLQRRYPNRHGITVGCSDVEIESPSERILEARIKRIDAQPHPVVLGLIGTLRTRYKGIQTIFKALGALRDHLPPVEFRILGGGDPAPWRTEAEQYGVADLVVFEGTIPAGEPVLRWLDGVDLYLQPSFKEGLPRALVEAMSRGCPAIASTCAGIPELLESECLIRPGDATHLAELIAYAFENPTWQRVQAERNWREAGEYARDLLAPRRQAFWTQFADHAADVKLRRGLS